jgi:lipoate synthase
VSLEEFAELKRQGYAMGFRHVESGPLVRSSFHASDAVAMGAVEPADRGPAPHLTSSPPIL